VPAEHYGLSVSAYLKEVVKVYLSLHSLIHLKAHHLGLAILPPYHTNALAAMFLTKPQKDIPNSRIFNAAPQ
jgi:hypothetical protein